MKFRLFQFFLTITIFSTLSIASEPDRILIHQQRLNGLDLSFRNLDESKTQVSSISASFSDIQISRTAQPARFVQDNAIAVELADNSILTLWQDEREGSLKIYKQIFDNLFNPINSNSLMAGSIIGADYVDPILKKDTLDRIYFFYRDKTRGLIFGSRYNPDLTIDIPEFLVNDTSSQSFAGPFDIDVFPDGRLVAVWENYDLSGSTIAYRVYSASGSSVFGPATANTDGGLSQHWVPSVSVEPGTGFLIVWEDYRNSKADIYAHLFAGDGTSASGDFSIVPPPADSAFQTNPEVIYSSKHKYMIHWNDFRDNQEIYAQRYDRNLGLIDGNVKISDNDSFTFSQDASCAMSDSSQLIVSWTNSGAENSLMAVKLDTNLNKIGTSVIQNNSSVGQRWSSHSLFLSENEYINIWTEFQGNDADITLMSYDTSGSANLPDEITVNDDQAGAPSVLPHMTSSTDWYNLIVWSDKRFDAGDIHIQSLSNAGIGINSNLRVDQDTTNSLQTKPVITSNSTKALAAWIDARPLGGIPGQRIYARFVSSFGELTTDEFLVSDTNEASVKNHVQVLYGENGRALITWTDKRSGSMQVYGRWVNSDGSLDGTEMLMSNVSLDVAITDLEVGIDDANNYYLFWFNETVVSPTIKGRSFNADKSDKNAFSFTSDLTNVDVKEMAIDISPTGTVLTLWSGNESGVDKLFLGEQQADGTVIVSSITVSDNNNANPDQLSVSVSNNNYISTSWIDQRDGSSRVYYQILDASRNLINTNQPVSTVIPDYMETPVTHAYRGRAWFVWTDPRTDGPNVFASNLVYLPTDIDDDPDNSLPDNYTLEQNYPNPFNPSTTISYSVPKTTNATLTIFNLLGQEVVTLVNGTVSAGEHKVEWNGRNNDGTVVSSGVYFYRLEADDTQLQRKMIFLK